jgi:hypothetical protein
MNALLLWSQLMCIIFEKSVYLTLSFVTSLPFMCRLYSVLFPYVSFRTSLNISNNLLLYIFRTKFRIFCYSILASYKFVHLIFLCVIALHYIFVGEYRLLNYCLYERIYSLSFGFLNPNIEPSLALCSPAFSIFFFRRSEAIFLVILLRVLKTSLHLLQIGN